MLLELSPFFDIINNKGLYDDGKADNIRHYRGITMDNSILTISERFEELRKKRDLTLEQLEKQTGLSKSALGGYEINSDKDIGHHAIVTLAKFYGVTSDYLLGLSDMENHLNADLNDLHLSDEMIELLKGGKINNRLLCEFAGHDGFKRFMIDLEIYVDRIANMRIHDINSMLKAERKAVMERIGLDEGDLYMRTLELAQVDEDDYFAHTIFEDLRPVIRDIREAHRSDTTTADITSPAEESLRQLGNALSYEGSSEEKMARVLLAQLDIDYDAITKEEFVTLIGILNKSSHMKRHISRRGKSRAPQGRKKKK